MYPEVYPYYGMLDWWVRIPDFVVVQYPSYVIAVSREATVWRHITRTDHHPVGFANVPLRSVTVRGN